MAFDWTKVEGYKEDLSDAEKIALLTNFNMPEAGIPKAQFDKVSSELAGVKKQLREKQTEDERKEAERLAAEKARNNELETLRREKALNSHKATYLAMGYSEALAQKAAEAMVDGKTDDLFVVMREHGTNVEKELRKKILDETPAPPAGEPGGEKTAGEKLAQEIAKKSTESAKTANDILSKYI